MEALSLALMLTIAAHLLQYRIGLNLADEGFLWNGVRRISQGKIPIRDYKSYDPGRYYWCWIWMRLFGEGLLALRHSAAIFQFFGLWMAIWILQSVTENVVLLTTAGIVLLMWMLPRHKVFEHAIALFAIGAALGVIQEPSVLRLFVAGAVIGLAAFMGRNHGVYSLAGIVSVIALLAIKDELALTSQACAAFAAGIASGYSPMLAMWAFIPGMASRYWHDKILVFFRRGGIDLPRRAPLPWRADYRDLPLVEKITDFLIGCHFLAVPLFFLVALAWMVISPTAFENGPLLAATGVGLFYMHHMASRSDFGHLCQCMQPFLIALFAVIYAVLPLAWSAAAAIALVAIAYFATRRLNMGIKRLENPESFVELDIHGDRIYVTKGIGRIVANIVSVKAERFAPDDQIFVAPMASMIYPILNLPTPVRSDFLHFPESDTAQESIIADLESNAVNWALIKDFALDGRDELRFRNTHDIVWNYLSERFEILGTQEIGPNWLLMKRKPAN